MMRYRVDYVSPWTAYTVDWYATLEACETDIATRYDMDHVEFHYEHDGVMRLTLSLEDNTVLELYEIEG